MRSPEFPLMFLFFLPFTIPAPRGRLRCDLANHDSLAKQVEYKWKKTDLTFSIENFMPNLMTWSTTRKAIRDSFAAYSAVTKLTFQEVRKGEGDIQLKFVRGEHGCVSAFDGLGGVVAHAKYPEEGIVHFDADEKFTVMSADNLPDDTNYTDFLDTAMHEIGHALGLEHEDDANSIMSPYTRQPVDEDGNYDAPKIDTVVVDKLQRKYGSRDNSKEFCVDALEWSTDNGQILVNDIPLVLKGINYHGFETEQFSPLGLTHQSLDDILDVIKNNNFNAIQIPFSMEMVRLNPATNTIDCDLNSDLCGTKALELLDNFIERAADRGLLVALSNNQFIGNRTQLPSPLWYNSQYSEEMVTNLWKKMIDRYSNQWNVFAIDLKNEPNGDATWGNSDRKTDWNKAAERMINKMSAINGLFFVDGLDWGNDLEGAGEYPIEIADDSASNRVVYTPHCYGPDVYDQTALNVKLIKMRFIKYKTFHVPNFPENLDELYSTRFGFLGKEGLTVIIGEWAADTVLGSRDEQWSNFMIDWLRQKCLTNNFYWSLNPASVWTRGLFNDDWITPDSRKLELLERLQPNPTNFEARDGKICIIKGAFPEKHCQND